MQRQGPATLEGATNRPNHCRKASLYSMDSAYPLSINQKEWRNGGEAKEVFLEEALHLGLIKIQKNGSRLSKR